MNREIQIANAFVLIAEAKHYMVGFVNIATAAELEKAKQILIVRSNAMDNKSETLELALELINQEIKGAKL